MKTTILSLILTSIAGLMYCSDDRVPNKAGRVRWNTTQIHRLLKRTTFPVNT